MPLPWRAAWVALPPQSGELAPLLRELSGGQGKWQPAIGLELGDQAPQLSCGSMTETRCPLVA